VYAPTHVKAFAVGLREENNNNIYND
jgi:hypothetical protein